MPHRKTISEAERTTSGREGLDRFLEPYLQKQEAFFHPAAALRYHALTRSLLQTEELPLPRFTLQVGDPLDAAVWRVGLFAGFRLEEKGVGKALLDWILGHQNEAKPGHGYEFFAYPVSDPQVLFPHSEAEIPHLLTELGHHRRRYPLHLVERELGIKEFHLVIALVSSEDTSWRASVAGPRWFEHLVAESVEAARSAEGAFPNVGIQQSPIRAKHPFIGFSRRMEGRRIQPLEIILEIPADAAQENPFPLRAALRHLLDSYRAFCVQQSDI